MYKRQVFVNSAATDATVYYQGVELSHKTSVNLPAGTSEIVVKNIAESIHENTLRIAAPKEVTVLSAQITTIYDKEYEIDAANPNLKRVKDSLQITENKLQMVKNEITSVVKTIELLDKNQTVYGVNNGLNLEELKKMIVYYQQQRTELSNRLFVLNEQEKELQQRLNDLRARLNWNQQNETGVSKGKLVLQVMSSKTLNAEIQLSYISDLASWAPFYDLRAESVSKPVNLLYKAEIRQNTGLNWKKINLTLYSGVPGENNEAPVLNAWFLRYYDPVVTLGYGRNNAVKNKIALDGNAVAAVEEVALNDFVVVN